jgi:hypothetical protein
LKYKWHYKGQWITKVSIETRSTIRLYWGLYSNTVAADDRRLRQCCYTISNTISLVFAIGSPIQSQSYSSRDQSLASKCRLYYDL